MLCRAAASLLYSQGKISETIECLRQAVKKKESIKTLLNLGMFKLYMRIMPYDVMYIQILYYVHTGCVCSTVALTNNGVLHLCTVL